MKLKDALIGTTYNVKDIQFCDDCSIEDGSCMILSLMENGLVPGTELRVIKKDLGLYYLNVDNSSFIIRKPEAERFNIEVE
jgi:Fe2+ transport system protein FeoA